MIIRTFLKMYIVLNTVMSRKLFYLRHGIKLIFTSQLKATHLNQD